MGPWEIGGIVIVVLVVFGAGRLAGVGKALGSGLREFREEAAKPVSKDSDSSTQPENSEEPSETKS